MVERSAKAGLPINILPSCQSDWLGREGGREDWEGCPLSADYNLSMLAVKVSSVNGVTALVFLHSTCLSNSV